MSIMDFLSSAGNFVSSPGVSDIVKLIAGISGQNKANKVVRQGNVPTSAETQSNALYQALIDPNNPLLKTLTDQGRTQGLNDFQSQIRSMQLADRRAGQMGHNPTFFNPERADEAISFLTSRGLPAINNMAGENAQNRILRAATGINGLMPAQVGRQQLGMAQGLSQAAASQDVPSQILKIIQSLGVGGGGQQQSPMYSPPITHPQAYGPQQPIRWN